VMPVIAASMYGSYRPGWIVKPIQWKRQFMSANVSADVKLLFNFKTRYAGRIVIGRMVLAMKIKAKGWSRCQAVPQSIALSGRAVKHV